MKKKLLSIIVIAFIILGASAQVTQTINISTAGTLSTQASAYLSTVTNLTVTGNIDQRDVQCMRDQMPLLAVLDISGVNIQSYNSFPANEMPSSSFYIASIGKPTLKTVLLPTSLTSIGAMAFAGCSGITSITLPSSVTSIGDMAFLFCFGITGTLTLPSNLAKIGDYAFMYCRGITGDLTFPASLTNTGDMAFQNCIGISSLTIPSTLDSIGHFAFSNCKGIKNLTISDGLTTIGSHAFEKCTGIAMLNLPSTLNTIGSYAFDSCISINSLILPNSLTSIESYAFNNCAGITGTLAIPTGITTINQYTFSGCTSISKLILHSGITKWGTSCFERCSGITGTLNIPSGINYIGDYNFYKCTGITTLILPGTLTRFEENAFALCSGIKTIYSLNPVPPLIPIANSIFGGTTSVTNVFVPTDDAVIDYKNDIYWFDHFPGNIIKKGIYSDISEITNNKIKVYSTNSTIIVEGTLTSETITVYSMNGIQLKKIKSQGEKTTIAFAHKGIYMLKISTAEGVVERKLVKK